MTGLRPAGRPERRGLVFGGIARNKTSRGEGERRAGAGVKRSLGVGGCLDSPVPPRAGMRPKSGTGLFPRRPASGGAALT
jgi:hypothetical protein